MEMTCETRPAIITFTPMSESSLVSAVEAKYPPMAWRTRESKSQPMKTMV